MKAFIIYQSQKYYFYLNKVKFFDYIISYQSILMEKKQIKAIYD